MRISAFIKATYIKIISLILALVFCLGLSSCARSGNLRTVGTVGEYEVPYEELYFLAQSYKSSLEDKYGEYVSLDAEKKNSFNSELRDLVYSNIITNYAILSICADEGLTLDAEGLDDRVDEYIDTIVESTFGGSKSDYKKSMEMYALTDHYVRFTAAVDFLYSDLLGKILDRSPISQDDAKMKEIVKNEFARTWHIMVLNDEGESLDDNRAKAEEALGKLRDGSMTMYNLIGSKYNEDFSITDLDGLYFARGSVNETYENAAFGLGVGEISDVVEISSTSAEGKPLTAFYIIQRLEIEDAYIDANISALREKYINSLIYGMLEERKSELVFVPNEYAKSLELGLLEDASNAFSNTFIIAAIACAAVACGAVIAVIIVKKKKSSALVEKTSKK